MTGNLLITIIISAIGFITFCIVTYFIIKAAVRTAIVEAHNWINMNGGYKK